VGCSPAHQPITVGDDVTTHGPFAEIAPDIRVDSRAGNPIDPAQPSRKRPDDP